MNSRIAVVGCGYWGKNLVRNFSELGVLGGVCDARLSLAEENARLYNVPVLEFEEILGNSDIQGVVIAAPAVQHADLARRALEAGKDVFVEKPLALNVNEAKTLCELAKQKGQVLMVGHLLQYHPAFLELKRRVQAGDLGRLVYLYSNRLSLGKFRREENVLWSFAPHDLSMILELVQDLPHSVQCSGMVHLHPHIQDTTTTYLAFKNGIQAHVFVSWLHPFKEQKLVVVGEQGMAVFDDTLPWDQKLKIYPSMVKWENGIPQPNKNAGETVTLENAEPLKLECQHFLECINSRASPRTDGREGARVLRVLDAAQRSLNEKRPVILEEKTERYFVHETAFVDEGCSVGSDTKIWHFSHILKGVEIGEQCVIGQNVMIGPDVKIGRNCKIQNNVSLYKGVVLEDGVFCGPSCVFTNVHTPRSEVERKDEFRTTYVEQGVTIGANATIVCGVRLGAYSFIGAGAVVTKDVKPHALIVGNPGRHVGWMSHAGEKLGKDLVCPREDRHYDIVDDVLVEKGNFRVFSAKSA